MKLICLLGAATSLMLFSPSCKEPVNQNAEMAKLLQSIFIQNEVPENLYTVAPRVKYYDSLIHTPGGDKNPHYLYSYASALVQKGEEKKSLDVYQQLLDLMPEENETMRTQVLKDMGIAWMRLGERSNCISNHTGESCIFPIKGSGFHADPMGSEMAIKVYEQLLTLNPSDMESRWLMNVAYMTIGGYPGRVPKEYLLHMPDDTSYAIKPFVDAAMKTGLNVNNVSGTSITEDFNNDGYFDLITSCMSLQEGLHYFINNGDGTFSDASKVSGLDQLKGGLNIQHTDYNNDGFKDIYVMRGGWKSRYGKEPNSLIRNNGDGTFTDVTKESGLLDFYPCMTSNWSDLNNDGWLDLIVGNEPVGTTQSPTQVYINNKNGTFTECSKKVGINIAQYSKGINTGDYNNDGRMDIYVAVMTGQKYLFKNTGVDKDGLPIFQDVSKEAGITNELGCFSSWFWDFDNDGDLDILNALYKNSEPIAYYAGAIAMGQKPPITGQLLLYKNNGDGTFTDVATEAGLNKMFFTMGSNFADIDNDGFLDFYMATGAPEFNSVYPNKLFRNINGKFFEDVTGSARVGSIQKSHGTSFADMDNDGDLDLYIEQGGPLEGDAYENAFFINPGQNDNHWVSLTLKGIKANAAAIGARIKVTFRENNVERSVYRSLTGGSSYGANTFTQHIGIGSAAKIDNIEIKWPGSGTVQNFTNIDIDKRYAVTEGDNNPKEIRLKKLDFLDPNRLTIGCAPLKLAAVGK